MALLTHIAPRPDQLVSQLCDELASPFGDVFQPEVVAVPTRGIERWLTQRIASDLAERGLGDGICANVEFPSPRRLIRDVLLQVPELSASTTAWEGSTLTGHVVDAIDQTLDQPWMRLIARYLEPGEGDTVRPNRLSAAQKVARLFSAYARRRPDMIRAWASGNNVGSGGGELPEGHLWQPLLWRAVRSRIDVPTLAELMPDALEPIRAGTVQIDLPERISVYGLTATDPSDLEVLVSLSAQRDVHLYILHPSPALWNAIGQHLHGGPGLSSVPARGNDTTEDLAVHPLLKAWARDSRELQTVLASQRVGGTPMDEPGEVPNTVLRRLQHDIRHNHIPTVDAQPVSDVEQGDDRSLQIHVCHGARRQVEVLRDSILHVLGADPTLEPRDIVIMTPDLETFAPLLEAGFPSEDKDLPDLRVRIADRSPGVTNPLVRFTASLVQLIEGRLEAGVIREMVAKPVVQEQFSFDAETAGQIVGLLDDANVAWGLDRDHRREWGAGGNIERTWGRGLDRALAGVFYPDSALRVVAETAPIDGIEGGEGTPVGLMAQVMDRIVAIRTLLGQPRPVAEWAAAISSSVRLLAAPAWGEEWQQDQLDRLLAETFPGPGTGAESSAAAQVISLPEAREAMGEWSDDRPSPLHFRTGNVTVCTLAPMRSVPYRVVCLLGLDDDCFPRRGRSDGDHLLLLHELVGDHDRSAEDRQLLLDAVMAAEQHLVITYSGRHELTNAELPPAVPVAELQDTLGEMLGADAHKRLITTHPLQAFSEANFVPGELGVAGPWAFDPMQLASAAAAQRSTLGTVVRAEPWPAWDEPERVRLEDLVIFLQHPAKGFVRTRLGFAVPETGDAPDDTLPAKIDHLSAWGLADRFLAGLVDGQEQAALVDRERFGDALPPGDLSAEDLAAALDSANTLWAAAEVRGYDPPGTMEVSGAIEVGSRVLEGSVLADPAHCHLVTLTPSRLKAKQRLKAYAELLFVSLVQPDIAWTALLLGKWASKRGSADGHLVITIGPIGTDAPTRRKQSGELVAALIDLYIEGHKAPVPMPSETAFAWQNKVAEGRSLALREARNRWESGWSSGEAADPAHQMLFPSLGMTEDLVAAGLDTYSERLWAPILALCTETEL